MIKDKKDVKHFLVIQNTNNYMDYYPASGETLQEAFKKVLKENLFYFGFDPEEFTDVEEDVYKNVFLTEAQMNKYIEGLINQFINIDNSHFTILDITNGYNVNTIDEI